MHFFAWVLFTATLGSLFLLAPTQANALEETTPRAELSILADKNLMPALTQLARKYNRAHHISVSVVARTSDTISEQIRDGLPVDVVLTSHIHTLQLLQQSGLIDLRSGMQIMRDHVVFARTKPTAEEENASEDGGIQIRPFDVRFIADYPLFILAADNDASLQLVEESLARIGLDPVPEFIIMPDETTLIHALQRTPDAVAILPQSLVAQHDSLRTLAPLTAGTNTGTLNGATYRAEVIASDHMKDARSFLQYLTGKEAQSVFAQYGFSPH